MPNWKKLITSGSDATLNSLFVTNAVTASRFSGSFTGSLFGTASWAQNSITASYALNAVSASFTGTASNVLGGTTNYLARWTSATTLGIGVTYDNGTNVGINTTSPTNRLTVQSGSGTDPIKWTDGTRAGFLYVDGAGAGVFSGATATGQGIYLNNTSNYLELWTNSSNKVRIDSNGNVGIGRTNPGYRLDISGSAGSGAVRVVDATTPSFFLNNVTVQWKAYISASSNDYRINDGIGDYVTIKYNSGNVGIGTTSPSGRLHVKSSGLSSYPFLIQRAANTNNIFYIFEDADGDGVATLENSSGAANAQLHSNGVSYFNGGNVGIGTTSPGGALDVVTGGGTNVTTYAYGLDTKVAAIGAWARSNRIYNSNYTASTVFFGAIGGASSLTYAYWSVGDPATADPSGYSTSNGIFLNSSANVGIGTTSPSYKLDTSGDIRSTGNIRSNNGTVDNILSWTSEPAGVVGTLSNHPETFWTNGSEKMRITSAGNVGIGAPAPASKLHISSSGIVARLESSTTLTQLDFYNSNYGSTNSRNWAIGTNMFNWGDFNIVSSATSASAPDISSRTYFTINRNGSVGIGTTSPSAKLHVSGNILSYVEAVNTAALFIAANNSNNWQFGINNGSDYVIAEGGGGNALGTARVTVQAGSGNVGLGTTSPAAKLTVVGNISSSADVYFKGLTSTPQATIVGINTSTGQLYYQTTSSFVASSASYAATASNVLGGTNNYLARWTSATTLGIGVTYDNGTNVGIGTTSPGAKLNLVASTENEVRVQESTNNNYISVYQQAVDSYIIAGTVTGTPSQALRIYTSGSERMRIANNGNVGIGTTSPSSKLDVAGIIVAGSNTATEGTTILQDQYSSGHLTNFGTNRSSGGPVIGYAVYPSSTTTNQFISSTGISVPRSALVVDTDFRWYTGDTQTVTLGTSASLSQKMILTSAGRLGIGISSPRDTLDINGGAIIANSNNLSWGNVYGAGVPTIVGVSGSSAYIAFYPAGSTSSEKVRIDVSGNVGIGTTSPGSKLEVSGSVRVNGTILGAGTDNTYYQIAFGDYNHRFFTRTNVGAALERFTIEGGAASGKAYFQNTDVGIGTSSPGAKLTVAGNISGSSAVYFSGLTSATQTNVVGIDTTTGQLYYQSSGSLSVSSASFATTAANVLGGTTNYLARWTSATTLGIGATYDNGTNVGIGTTSPDAFLRVNGTTKIGEGVASNTSKLMVNTTSGVAAGIQLFQDGVESWIIQNIASSTALTFGNSGNERMRITSDGNVGIGTTSPTSKLHVSVGNVDGIRVDSTNSGYLETGKSGGARWRWANEYNAANILELLVNDLAGSTPTTNVLTVSGSGNVGIGTTSPSQKLEVNGGAKIGSNFQIDSNGDVYQLTTGGAALWAATANTTYPTYGFYGDTGIGMYRASADILAFATNASERMRIDASGNVGIGTTSPGTLLQIGLSNTSTELLRLGVSYNVASTQRGAITWHDGTGITGKIWTTYNGSNRTDMFFGGLYNSAYDQGTYLTILGTGNVGIGTTSPSAQFVVSNAGASGFEVNPTGGVSSGVLLQAYNRNTSAYMAQSYYALAHTFNVGSSGGTRALDIDSNGNVGIGTTSPAAKLHVTGSGNTVLIGDTSTGGILYFGSIGNNHINYGSSEFQIRTNQCWYRYYITW